MTREVMKRITVESVCLLLGESSRCGRPVRQGRGRNSDGSRRCSECRECFPTPGGKRKGMVTTV